MSVNTLIPVILCGGNGTRLWPLSRESFPKQYLTIDGDHKKSFLQKRCAAKNNAICPKRIEKRPDEKFIFAKIDIFVERSFCL